MPDERKKSDVAKREEEILKFWQENKIFEKSLEKESPEGEFIFYDGPPFATGTPHFGHLIPSSMKDAIPRYKTMRGYHVPRRWGWDCHGLPIENLIEKELGLKEKKDIEELGIEKFNEAARASVLRYAEEWKRFVPRAGRWVDMENDYRTMDTEYIESVWWVFKSLYEKDLVYKGFVSMHICPRCETTLAQAEVAEGYADVKDWSVTVEFPLKDESNTVMLAWTTTPWTLPGNVALAVGADIEYVVVEREEKKFILAKELVEQVFGDTEHTVVDQMKGSSLVGKEYIPPFDSYMNDESLENRGNAWQVYAADFITTEQGTGIAHEAPAFGAEDMELAQKVGLPLIHHIGMDGVIKPEVKELAGLKVKVAGDTMSTDVEVIKVLAEKGVLFAKEKITHAYPLCWRCDTPLLNYATSSWFIAVTKIKDELLKANDTVYWMPESIKYGRFGKWLEGARDWAVSRARYWGAPIPIWMNEETGEIKVIGSIEELRDYATTDVPEDFDLHKPYIDDVVLKGEKGAELTRVPYVFDCWFESGSMPYAQKHYPFENTDIFEPEDGKGFPADFIAEGTDQTRGWFYSLMVLGVALFGTAPYKSVVVNGMIMAADGKKMSKKLKNYTDPHDAFDWFGADAIRLYLLSSPVVRAENPSFIDKNAEELSNKVLGRLHNVHSLYELYKDTVEHSDSSESTNSLDQWIIARTRELHRTITDAMETYALDQATRPIPDFVDDLSTWYIRRSRDRFKGEDKADKKAALETTRWVLRKYAKMTAPFMPFMADWLWQRVKRSDDPESVHLTNWCSVREFDEQILSDMKKVREVVSLALEARASAGIKVRQPLASLSVKTAAMSDELVELVRDEVNVKEVVFDESIENEVELDTHITEELKREGMVRDLIRHIQQARKNAGCTPEDQVVLTVSVSDEGQKLIEEFKEQITKTALIKEVIFADVESEPVSVGEIEFTFSITA